MIDRPAWHDFAACRTAPKRLFFPDAGVNATEALRVCAGCPVRTTCLNAHLQEKHGVWGGTTERDRRALRRTIALSEGRNPPGRPYMPDEDFPHGTLAGYRAHKRRGEDACGPCLRANAATYYPKAVSA